MRLLLPAFAALLLAGAAAAQVPQPPPSIDDRVAAQIGALVLQNTRQAIQIEMLQRQLAEAQERLKKIETPSATATPAPKN